MEMHHTLVATGLRMIGLAAGWVILVVDDLKYRPPVDR